MRNNQLFTGFPEEGIRFLEQLAENNNRTWFEANQKTYQMYLLEPAVAFVAQLGKHLQTISPHIRYDTRTNGSGTLMRIHRDTRFSQDKTPYKTNISGLFWEGNRKKTECPAFGFHLGMEGMRLMAGIFVFPKDKLDAYRRAVVDTQFGAELAAAITAVQQQGRYEPGGRHYKTVPRGYDAAHERAELLLYNGLYVHPPLISREQTTSPAILDICLAHFQQMAPIQQWLVQAIGSVQEAST